MSYIGTQPSYGAFEKQFFTGDGTNSIKSGNVNEAANAMSSHIDARRDAVLKEFYS